MLRGFILISAAVMAFSAGASSEAAWASGDVDDPPDNGDAARVSA
jgi:hypothetical protein